MASTRPDTKYFATCSQDEVLVQLGSSLARGLSADEASRRLEKEGYNEITANQVRWWEIAFRQFRSAFIYLLLVAAVIVILIGEYVDGAIILGFVLVNALPGFSQEGSARNTGPSWPSSSSSDHGHGGNPCKWLHPLHCILGEGDNHEDGGGARCRGEDRGVAGI